MLCRVLGLARSGYYAWRAQPAPSAHAQRDTDLTTQIRTIVVASRQTYGSPRVHAELRAQGVRVARKRVARLMRQARLVARQRPRRVRTTVADPTAPVVPNHLNRQFQTPAPNRVWVADFTALPTREGWLYLAVVLDLYARRVVGWAMRPTMADELVRAALQDALQRRRPPRGFLHHSDRGTQYTSDAYRAMLVRAGAQPSLSRRANCWDNAVVESFFASLKVELGQPVFASHTAARDAVVRYIEGFYNRRRRHSTLGYRTPEEAERQFAAQATA